MSINLKDIVLNETFNNKSIYVSATFLFVALLISQIIFPKMYGGFVASIPEHLETLNFQSVGIVLLPYIISEFLFYVSDVIDSNTYPKMEMSVIKKVTEDVIESVKTTKKEINSNELILNLKKIFDIRNIYHLIVTHVVPAIIVSVAIGMYFLQSDTKVGLGIIVILILTFVSLLYMSNNCSSQTAKAEENVNIFCDDIHDVLANIDNVVASGTDKIEIDGIDIIKEKLAITCVEKEMCNTQMKFLFSIVYFIIMIVLNGFAIKLYYDEKLSKESLITIFFMVLSLVQMYDSLIYEFRNITNSVGNFMELERYFAEFKLDDTKLDNMFKITNGNIQFKNINLSFDNRTILTNFNLTIEGNKKTGIIGEMGGGKTSLLKILLDLIKYNGDVLIDGQNTKRYDHNIIMKHVTYVPQNPKLFNRTIYENLAYGTDYTKQKVIEIIKKYDLSEFFTSFKKGLDTKVGKNGEKVSGGQRQMIFIMRVLIQDKKIILFDEPTASLDFEHKLKLIDLIKKIKNKTIIIVTHDTTIFDVFDKIILMENGEIKKIY